jgi:hypothetical protein
MANPPSLPPILPSQQFFDISRFEDGVSSYQDVKNQSANPTFAWPKDYFNRIDGTKVVLQRGYIKLITNQFTAGANKLGQSTSSIQTFGNRRCFFQFNPDSITRGLQQRQDMQLWINMDPGQMGQAMPGNQNFAFSLLFNREAEVAANGQNKETFNAPDIIPGSANTSGTISVANTLAVGEIGVLADLNVLDSIIGVGLSAETFTFVQNIVNNQLQILQKASATVNADGSSTSSTDKLIGANGTDFFQLNLGNQAFLVPNPIRVVFSRLFMLDGYITSISVTFNKFNPSMIPVQCTVDIQMEAMYFGFAQKNTYLTHVLDSGGDNSSTTGNTIPTDGSEQQTTELATIQAGLGSLISSIEHVSQLAAFGQPDYFSQIKDYDNGSGSQMSFKFEASQVLTSLLSGPTVSGISVEATAQLYQRTSGLPWGTPTPADNGFTVTNVQTINKDNLLKSSFATSIFHFIKPSTVGLGHSSDYQVNISFVFTLHTKYGDIKGKQDAHMYLMYNTTRVVVGFVPYTSYYYNMGKITLNKFGL